MISMQELADICGYSRVSVSAALNGKGGISDKAREKILRTAREHNYVPNKMATALKGMPSFLIGMLVRDLSNPFYTQMIKIIDDHLNKEGYSLIVLNSMADAERERKAIQTLYSYNVYQIEGEGKNLFEKIKGDANTIMGLPIKKIKDYLNK